MTMNKKKHFELGRLDGGKSTVIGHLDEVGKGYENDHYHNDNGGGGALSPNASIIDEECLSVTSQEPQPLNITRSSSYNREIDRNFINAAYDNTDCNSINDDLDIDEADAKDSNKNSTETQVKVMTVSRSKLFNRFSKNPLWQKTNKCDSVTDPHMQSNEGHGYPTKSVHIAIRVHTNSNAVIPVTDKFECNQVSAKAVVSDAVESNATETVIQLVPMLPTLSGAPLLPISKNKLVLRAKKINFCKLNNENMGVKSLHSRGMLLNDHPVNCNSNLESRKLTPSNQQRHSSNNSCNEAGSVNSNNVEMQPVAMDPAYNDEDTITSPSVSTLPMKNITKVAIVNDEYYKDSTVGTIPPINGVAKKMSVNPTTASGHSNARSSSREILLSANQIKLPEPLQTLANSQYKLQSPRYQNKNVDDDKGDNKVDWKWNGGTLNEYVSHCLYAPTSPKETKVDVNSSKKYMTKNFKYRYNSSNHNSIDNNESVAASQSINTAGSTINDIVTTTYGGKVKEILFRSPSPSYQKYYDAGSSIDTLTVKLSPRSTHANDNKVSSSASTSKPTDVAFQHVVLSHHSQQEVYHIVDPQLSALITTQISRYHELPDMKTDKGIQRIIASYNSMDRKLQQQRLTNKLYVEPSIEVYYNHADLWQPLLNASRSATAIPIASAMKKQDVLKQDNPENEDVTSLDGNVDFHVDYDTTIADESVTATANSCISTQGTKVVSIRHSNATTNDTSTVSDTVNAAPVFAMSIQRKVVNPRGASAPISTMKKKVNCNVSK